MNYHFDDFTEENYRRLIRLAKDNYKFILYDGFKTPGKNVLWRHDVDFSVHRAVKLAAIEAEAGLRCTYFIHLHSIFYHPLEKQAAGLIHEILAAGHELGLHFDPDFYDVKLGQGEAFEEALLLEKRLLESVFKKPVRVFSFHNPGCGGWMNFEHDVFAGMVNTYGAYFKKHYSYCSDSNGYWRFRRLQDTLEESQEEKLQILTHPAWWTPETMPPRQRISRAIDGRARASHEMYDGTLAKYGRENVRG